MASTTRGTRKWVSVRMALALLWSVICFLCVRDGLHQRIDAVFLLSMLMSRGCALDFLSAGLAYKAEAS